MTKTGLAVSMTVLFLHGCTLAKVQVNVASERTSLENQVLGTYNALDREMLLAASVRGVDPSGRIQAPTPKSQEHEDALIAVQTLAFHEDDCEGFKRLGWVGENNQGLLTPFPREAETVPPQMKEFAERFSDQEFITIVDQANAAREVLIRRVVALNENFTESDLPRVRQAFGKINAENALPGEKVQREDGTWTVKKK